VHYPPVSAADACNALTVSNLQENLLKDDEKGDKESNGLLLPFSSLMVLENSKNPLHHSSYFTHVRSMPSAGERHAFRVSSLQLEVSSYLPVISSGPRPEGEGSREILSCRSIAKREKSHADSADNADFLFYANRCPLMPAKAGWQIPQNRTEKKRKHRDTNLRDSSL